MPDPLLPAFFQRPGVECWKIPLRFASGYESSRVLVIRRVRCSGARLKVQVSMFPAMEGAGSHTSRCPDPFSVSCPGRGSASRRTCPAAELGLSSRRTSVSWNPPVGRNFPTPELFGNHPRAVRLLRAKALQCLPLARGSISRRDL